MSALPGRPPRAALARRKLGSLQSLPWRERALIAEAALLLGSARLTLRLLPFRWFQPWFSAGGSPAEAHNAADAELVTRVSRAIRIASRNLPFDAVCLPRAMAAKLMLARRGTGSALFIGAGRGADGRMILHAWLESGGTIVTGGAGRSSVTPVVKYG